jgi:uncharacterized membrane protein YccC
MSKNNVSPEVWISFWFTIIGFFIGGIAGAVFDTGFHPYCWYGAAIGFVVSIGGCLCLWD